MILDLSPSSVYTLAIPQKKNLPSNAKQTGLLISLLEDEGCSTQNNNPLTLVDIVVGKLGKVL